MATACVGTSSNVSSTMRHSAASLVFSVHIQGRRATARARLLDRGLERFFRLGTPGTLCNPMCGSPLPKNGDVSAGRASATRQAHMERGSKRMPGHLQGRDPAEVRKQEAVNATVYGVYSAVQYADAVMLQRLQRSLPALLTGGLSQNAHYSIEVLCSLLGDAAASNCCNLMDHYTQVCMAGVAAGSLCPRPSRC